jgi:hypothetical protein
MTQPRHEITTKKVLLQLPGMDAVTSRLVEFAGADGQPLPLQVYYPAGVARPVPAVVIVEGYADPGFTKFFGCRFGDGLVGVDGLDGGIRAGGDHLRDPRAKPMPGLLYVSAHADVLGVDATRTGLWAPPATALRCRCSIG